MSTGLKPGNPINLLTVMKPMSQNIVKISIFYHKNIGFAPFFHNKSGYLTGDVNREAKWGCGSELLDI